MRRYIVLALLCCTFSAHALESLRIGSQLLVVGDSAAKVKELLGKPSGHSKSSGSGKHSRKASGSGKGVKVQPSTRDTGEKWLYRRDGHSITVTIADGKVVHIEDMMR